MRYKLYTPLYIHELGHRTNQEDSLFPQEPTADSRLFVLCDGMGGHEHGEVASQTVCTSLGEWFETHVTPDEPFTDNQLRMAIEYAYTKLDGHITEGPKQMGTTLTLLYMHRHGVTAAHIGDSRIYHIRPSKGLLYQSRDHSLVVDLYQAGEISYEEMATYPKKNIVTRAMTPGEDNRMRPDIIHITDVKADDWFFMCSDGMMEQMGSSDLAALLSADKPDKEKCLALRNATAANQDNHTAWLIHVEEVVGEKGDDLLENEEGTARCNWLNMMPKERSVEEASAEAGSDVVVISVPPSHKQKPSQVKKPKTGRFSKIRKLLIAIFLLALLAFIGWRVVPRSTLPEKPKTEQKKKKNTSKKNTRNRNTKPHRSIMNKV